MTEVPPGAEPLSDASPGVLPAEARHLRVTLGDGVSIAVTCLPGEGEPVLWLHPSRTSRRVFDHALVASRLGRPVFAPDLRGHGDSDRPASPNGLEEHVADLERFVDVMALDRFSLVGQATGATLSLMLATRLGDRVSALAIGDVALGIRSSVYALVEEQERGFASKGFASPDAAMDATPFSERWSPSVRAHWLATMLTRSEDGAWRWNYDGATVLATMAQMVEDRWDRIDVAAPTLLFRGALNTAIERREIDRALRRLPNARAVELEGADHRLCQDAPEAFAELVDGFLAVAI